MLWPTDPFKEIERMRGEMDRIFSRIPFFGAVEYQFPLVNLYDSGENLVLISEIPGLSKESINLNFSDGILVISGKREPRKYGKSNMLRQEQPEGEFEKKVKIPLKIKSSEIKAKFEDGMLSVILPKSEEAKAKKITVES